MFIRLANWFKKNGTALTFSITEKNTTARYVLSRGRSWQNWRTQRAGAAKVLLKVTFTYETCGLRPRRGARCVSTSMKEKNRRLAIRTKTWKTLRCSLHLCKIRANYCYAKYWSWFIEILGEYCLVSFFMARQTHRERENYQTIVT